MSRAGGDEPIEAEMEDCVKRDVKKTGGEGDWKKKTEEGGEEWQMRRRKSFRQHLTPDKGKKRKKEAPKEDYG